MDDGARRWVRCGLSETVARKGNSGWELHGTKWFTSATTSEIALTLARPEEIPGGKGLALYVEQRNMLVTCEGFA